MTRKEHLLNKIPNIEYLLPLKELNLILEAMEESTNEQLSISGVVGSVPSKQEITVKAFTEAKKHKLNNDKIDLKGYAFGFVDGANYINEQLKK